eukprot:11178300-Lingulodinium_polyedra.AAC.1
MSQLLARKLHEHSPVARRARAGARAPSLQSGPRVRIAEVTGPVMIGGHTREIGQCSFPCGAPEIPRCN